jgi:3-deoxy-D-manno-octulosonic-acid transferase
MYFLYSALLGLGLLASLPYWLFQMGRHGKYRAGLGTRLGRVPAHLRALAGQRTVWVHAVSVGEVLAVVGLIEELQQALPQHHVLLSTTTMTGFTLASRRLGEENVFYFPLDFAFAIRPYIRALKPDLVALAETEFWPNFLRLAAESGARIAVVNARISDRSLRGYRRFRRLVRRVLQNVDLFLAQTEQDRVRLMDIGARADSVEISGNLKFDFHTKAMPPLVSTLRAALTGAGAGPVLVCGSTLQGEELALLQTFRVILAVRPRTVMILAPRHPERFENVAELLAGASHPFWRRSQWNREPLAGGVFLLDSIGELGSIYSLATIAFVGGSLVPKGGHNIIEPAQFGVPILIGPHTENFRDIVDIFARMNAVKTVDSSTLATTILELLANEPARTALGQRGLAALQSQAGATGKTVAALRALVNPTVGPAASVRAGLTPRETPSSVATSPKSR